MGIANDMKNLGEDIVASYGMRVKAIGTLAKDTHKMLKGFRSEHKEMAGILRAGLEKAETARLKNFKSMMADIQKAIKEIEAYTANKLKEFHTAHEEMAANLRKSLEQGETDRIKAFKPMMADIQKGIREIETYVKNKLKEFSDAHADMSEELKKALAKYVDDMVKATKKLMSDIQKRQKERNAEVADLLEAFKTEREKMAANWQTMAETMAKKRGVMPKVEAEVKVRPVPKVEAEVKVRPVKEAIEELKPVEEVEEEVTVGEDPEERVLEFINRHPAGVKVGDMEEPLGVARTRLGVIAKRLLEAGRVRKEGDLYFPLW